MEGGTELVLLTGWTETPVWRSDQPEWEFGDPWRSGMTDFSLDDRGRIIAVLENQDVLVLKMPDAPELPDQRRNPRRQRR